MVHAWVWLDNPDGVFADQHRALPYLRAGLPLGLAATGGQASAWGVALIDGGCKWELTRLKRVAGIDGQQQKTVVAECQRAADRVRSAVADEANINSAASAAWTDYARVRDGLLRPDQQGRLAAIVEYR